MRTAFHAELDELIADLAKMVRLVSRMVNNASIALHQGNFALAGLVIADHDEITAMLKCTEQRCVSVLALQAPVAGDLRMVVTALHAVSHLTRMGNLTWRIALMAQLKQPNPMVISEIRPVLARMSLLASQLAEDAASAIEHPDPLSDHQLAVVTEDVDTLHHRLHSILFSENWSHGVEQAVDTALIACYYERFADHAVAIAGQACYMATGHPGWTGTVTADRAGDRA